MFQHYLMTALRNFLRYRVSTVVNLLCLALGITCFVITYAVTAFLSNSDQQFGNADRTQVLTVNFRNPVLNNVQFGDCPCTGPAVAESLRTDFPQLESVARLSQVSYPSIAAGDKAIRAAVSYADPQFYDIFDLPFRPGLISNCCALRAAPSSRKTQQCVYSVPWVSSADASRFWRVKR